MSEGAFNVEAVAGGTAQYPDGNQVDDQPRTAGHQHDAGSHLRDFPKAVVSLKENPAGNHPQTDYIEQGGQHLSAVISESALNGGWPVGNPHREKCQCDGGRVGEHMGGVGQQGQTARQNARYYLNPHKAGNQRQRNQQASPPGLPVAVGRAIVVAGSSRCHTSARDLAAR